MSAHAACLVVALGHHGVASVADDAGREDGELVDVAAADLSRNFAACRVVCWPSGGCGVHSFALGPRGEAGVPPCLADVVCDLGGSLFHLLVVLGVVVLYVDVHVQVVVCPCCR